MRTVGDSSTRVRTFRHRAEARQREYRANVLRAGWAKHQHWLDRDAVEAGRNFVVPAAHAAALARAECGKGVGERTFVNMLSSQAMCFNVFAPLAADHELAAEVMGGFIPDVTRVHSIEFEYTPPNETFRDQTGQGGVDCDLLLDIEGAGGVRGLVAIETKFVEREFSSCGFRKSGRAAKGLAVCAEAVPARDDHSACLYTARKGYLYWDRTRELTTLSPSALAPTGCPFGGTEWQLWVNHTLVHAEASRRRAERAMFVVCAPQQNEALLGDGVLDRFRGRLANPATFAFVALDELLAAVERATRDRPLMRSWTEGLLARYGNI
jgi:hypothetical protein